VQRGATLEARIDETPEVEVDVELMQDAIGNLLDNALKYNRPGIAGLCRIRTGFTRRWVIIEVSDNGLGVPPDKRSLVFERFTRVEGPGRGKAGGHGLGLAFVADTATAHDGLVECVDGIDGGATFRIKLRRR
jgi:signal transduction histidine kinase